MSAPEHDQNSAILSVRMEAIGSDLQEIKATMKELASAVSRLAIVEERQNGTNESLGRAFNEITRLTGRVVALEHAQPIQKQSSDFVQAAVKYLVAAVLGAILAGFLRVPPTVPTATPPALTGK